MPNQLVIIESPFAGDIQDNLEYGRKCVRDCLQKGEVPFASHLFYTQEGILDDTKPEERKLGIEAGFAWAKAAGKTVVYVDKGISKGVHYGIMDAIRNGRPVQFRSLHDHVVSATWAFTAYGDSSALSSVAYAITFSKLPTKYHTVSLR